VLKSTRAHVQTHTHTHTHTYIHIYGWENKNEISKTPNNILLSIK